MTRIHEIQGAVHRTALLDSLVTIEITIPVICVAVDPNGFFAEERDVNWDASLSTSQGIFVETDKNPSILVGDAVWLVGRVRERREFDSDLSITVIDTTSTGGSFTVTSSGNTLPTAVVIGTGGRTPPTEVVDPGAVPTGNVETSGVFDLTHAIDFYETLEGMRVQINNAVVVGPNNGGEIVVVPDGGSWITSPTARGGMLLTAADRNPERLVLSPDLFNAFVDFNVGDEFTAPIYGVMSYSHGMFKVLVTNTLTRVDNGLTRADAVAAAAGELRVATFNTHGMRGSEATAVYDGLAEIIVAHLACPDIIVLEEVQDNSGVTNSGIVDATASIGKLAAAVLRAGGPQYAWRQIDPENNADGGTWGGNIRSVLFFRTDRGLMFVERLSSDLPATANNLAVTGEHGLEVTLSPGRIAPTDEAFENTRKSFVGEFLFDGHRLFVICNHLKSKTEDEPYFGRYQPPTAYTDAARQEQALVVCAFIFDLKSIDADAKIICLGDFNDFEYSDTAILFKDHLTCLTDSLDADNRYTFVQEGNSQAIDHVFVSTWIEAKVTGYDILHVNSEFSPQVSDHDPALLTLVMG